MRRFLRTFVLAALLLSLMFLGTASPAVATAIGNDVIVNVFTGQNAYVATFAANGTSRARIDHENTMRVVVSPNNAWVGAYTSQGGRELLAYRRSNGGPVFIPVDAGYTVLSISFSDDSRFFLYLFANVSNNLYVQGIVNLINGTRAEFTGSYGTRSVFGSGRLGWPINFDGTTLLVQGVVPFSDAFPQGMFRVNLTGYDFIPAGRYLMPPATRILGNGEVGKIALSPNGRTMAVLYFDPINPPQGYVQEGPGIKVNALATINIATGQIRVIARAGQGQGLETMSWTQDSRYIMFTGGNWQNTSYLVNPRMYIVEVATGQVTEVGPTTTNPQEIVADMLVCGNSLFSTSLMAGGTSPNSTLYVSPINNPASRQQIGTAGSILLYNCASR